MENGFRDDDELREFYRGKIVAILNVEDQSQHAAEPDSIETDSMRKKPPMTAASYRLRKKLESMQ
jgi:hypothetical protein